jgi:hypothetical protein
MWPNCWQLWHCIRAFWALYASTLIALWQKFGKHNISCTFAILGKVTRKRGRFMILDSAGGDRRVAVICLTQTTSKLRFPSPSEVSSAGVFCGRWHITTFMGLTDFGKKEQ